eukprot:TRINITY_DN40147_c0_g1_i1.p1 TRINITY_DN40147_c0_g1~~TRINITY_DN40147_c0_g1_i1.p1  ORF type:complete len:295 (-),score=76.73 TRINITY_DN40147_c0_g1_i1:16-900(-)
MMPHGGVAGNIALCAGMCVQERERWCFSNNYTFDVHIADVYFPLSVGALLVLTIDIFRIAPVDIISTLPNKIAVAKVPSSLEWVRFTGEPVTDTPIRNIPPSVKILNIYGATEFFDATFKQLCSADFCPLQLRTIGAPLPGVQCYVIDPDTLALQPTGEAGELLIGGSQLSRGYIKKPEVNSAKFIQAPWTDVPCRVYRTGDLVRALPSGEYEYIGRTAHQVELRGERFDLCALEAEICTLSTVTEAVALVQKNASDEPELLLYCLLYTSDAADEEDSVDLGGRRIIEKKKNKT